MMSDLSNFELTNPAEINVASAVQIARSNGTTEVLVHPLHLAFALLCEDPKALDMEFFTPEVSSLFWVVVERENGDPNAVAKELKKRILDVKEQQQQTQQTSTSSQKAPLKEKENRKLKNELGTPAPKRGNFLSVPKFGKKATSSTKEFPRTPSSATLLSDGDDISRSTTPNQPNTSKPIITPELVKIMEGAKMLANEMEDIYISPHHLLLALLDDIGLQTALTASGLDAGRLAIVVRDYKGNQRIQSKKAGQKLRFLNKFALDLTAMAQAGSIDPVIGRDAEIRRVIRILCRRTKNSPVLLGEPGVGKTAIAEGLAQRIVDKDVPASLNAKVFSLDMGALIAGTTSRGEYEERIKNILDEIAQSEIAGEPIVLFIDELHLIMAGKSQSGGNGGMDAANLLKPALARGRLRCIGATTLAEYREHIEKDGALERRFAQVIVNEPSVPDTITILRGVRESYAIHHGVRILDGALVTAANLAHRYITQRRLPDSAIDIIDEASAAAKVTRETLPEDIDRLQREKYRLQMDIGSLEGAKEQGDHDPGVSDRLKDTQKDLAEVDYQISLLNDRYRLRMSRWKQMVDLRKEINQVKMKQRDATRRHDAQEGASLREKLNEAEAELRDLEKQHSTSQEPMDLITPESIAAVVERSTGIPVKALLASDRENLLDLEKDLQKKVIGQPEAVRAVANAIQRSRNGLGDETRPIASFLFTGASGTGKTHLSKILAECLFKSQSAMTRIDGSEYSASHSVSRLVGSPPGYVGYEQGGQLTEAVRRNPYCIILIDEIEKTCPEFVTLFLQVLDDGRLTDGKGRVVDFRNTVIIMTSNLGSEFLADQMGEIDDDTKGYVEDAIHERFPIEFVNRIDEIIIFRTLTREGVQEIVNLRLNEIQQLLNRRHLTFDLDNAARLCLADVALNSNMGARPLMRVIQRDLVNQISTLLLQDRIKEGENVKVRVRGDEIYVEPNHEDPRHSDQTQAHSRAQVHSPSAHNGRSPSSPDSASTSRPVAGSAGLADRFTPRVFRRNRPDSRVGGSSTVTLPQDARMY